MCIGTQYSINNANGRWRTDFNIQLRLLLRTIEIGFRYSINYYR